MALLYPLSDRNVVEFHFGNSKFLALHLFSISPARCWFMLHINILMSSLPGPRQPKKKKEKTNKKPPFEASLSWSGSPQQSIKRYQPVTQSWLIANPSKSTPFADCLRTFVLLRGKAGENFWRLAVLQLLGGPEIQIRIKTEETEVED